MTNEPIKPITDTDPPAVAAEPHHEGSAQRPSDQLDKGEPDGETIPRKSSLL